LPRLLLLMVVSIEHFVKLPRIFGTIYFWRRGGRMTMMLPLLLLLVVIIEMFRRCRGGLWPIGIYVVNEHGATLVVLDGLFVV